MFSPLTIISVRAGSEGAYGTCPLSVRRHELINLIRVYRDLSTIQKAAIDTVCENNSLGLI